jgi:3alpha(or 20beta)-hydroxysteroid dehydrogenase
MNEGNTRVGKLDGKVVMITGGAGGMGAAESRLFAAEGAQVVIADVRVPEGEALAAEIGDAAMFALLDVSDPAAWQRTVDDALARFGHVCGLVNNAGILITAPIRDLSLDDYRRTVEINQIGTWLGLKTVIGPMEAAGGGAIVLISSLAGLTGGGPGMSAYASTKYAVRGLARVAAAEFGQYGVRVNTVFPGAPTCRAPRRTS